MGENYILASVHSFWSYWPLFCTGRHESPCTTKSAQSVDLEDIAKLCAEKCFVAYEPTRNVLHNPVWAANCETHGKFSPLQFKPRSSSSCTSRRSCKGRTLKSAPQSFGDSRLQTLRSSALQQLHFSGQTKYGQLISNGTFDLSGNQQLCRSRDATRLASAATDAAPEGNSNSSGKAWQQLKTWIRRLLLLLAVTSACAALLVSALPSMISTPRWRHRLLGVCNRFLPGKLAINQARPPIPACRLDDA